jgi:glycopeptide antibiotics resistance protein
MEIEIDSTRISTVPLAIALVALIVYALWRQKRSYRYFFCVVLFSIYVLLAVDKVFFPIIITGDMRFTEQQFMRSVNLIPFNFNFAELPRIVLLQIVQNILLTMPFGFGINFLAKVSAKDLLWLCPAIGLCIETIQLLISLALGYPYRIIDINDAILNATGVALGYGAFRLVERLGLTSACYRFD